MHDKPTTIDQYLANVADDHRPALERLRVLIHSLAPGSVECISYSLPAFRHNGKLLVGFGASAKHCAFYLFSGATVDAHAEMMKGYDTSKGTIRFTPDRPLPDDLIATLVAARIAENAAG